MSDIYEFYNLDGEPVGNSVVAANEWEVEITITNADGEKHTVIRRLGDDTPPDYPLQWDKLVKKYVKRALNIK